jgi:hypothetical protein
MGQLNHQAASDNLPLIWDFEQNHDHMWSVIDALMVNC